MKQPIFKNSKFVLFAAMTILTLWVESCSGRRRFSGKRQSEQQLVKQDKSYACWQWDEKNKFWTGPFPDRPVEENNKQLVREFYQKVFGDKEVDAIDLYISEVTYIQHNPHFADGREALKEACRKLFKDAPQENIDIQRISAEGDLVWVHVKTMDEGKLTSVIDIFRFGPDRKIVEHWDVWQAVPETAANAHPMF